MLKRAIAREMLRLLTNQISIDDYNDLRPARQSKNITLTAVAKSFDVWPTIISRLERGLYRNDAMADRYRRWLTAARQPIGASGGANQAMRGDADRPDGRGALGGLAASTAVDKPRRILRCTQVPPIAAN